MKVPTLISHYLIWIAAAHHQEASGFHTKAHFELGI